MSKQSDCVKKWRENCKLRIIEAMGGKCVICGYNKCSHALALHHLDPSKKEFPLASIRANPKNWISIIEELRKCVLLCHNCHSELHSGIINIPENCIYFNEEFIDYKKFEQKSIKLLTPCPVCGKLKSEHLKHCSKTCASKSYYKINWDNINLIEELKTKTIVKLAEEIGCSDSAIYNRLKKLNLK